MEAFIQVSIVLITCTSIWLLQRNDKWSRWGFVIGLFGFPFWLITSIREEQWGIVFVSIWFAMCNVGGILKRFNSPEGTHEK